LDAERGALASADVLEGTLAYLSPEQTGRMNRLVDYRADFYSLGVTLYELLTGQLPFHAPDAMGLVHAHVARVPVSPQALLPSIPAPLSEITMRLLAKNAEDRYQSASGILADLERVRDALRTRDEVESFTLAADDTYERFRLPAKLYGRAASREAILAAFERASAGGNELLLIGGPSGIGKSALIRELHREMVKLRGHFVTGKFDLQERDRPYAAVAQALRALARALLLEPEDRLRAWASALRTALGPNGQVALDLAPELERVIGPQPPLRPLPPSETANRFRVTTHALFKALAGERHPLVLFLDDLQWSDLATLQLIEQLAADPELTHVLWIGAYRDSEVPADHNLERAVAALLEAGAAVERLTLGPLDEEPIALLLVDALHHAPDVVRPLAALLREKTEGNPFFVRAYLESLHERGELRFDQRRGSWTWSLDQVAQAELPDDAAALVAARIAKLPSAAQELLRDAACVGARFELQVVARLLELTGADALARLWPAVTRGLVRPLDEHYKFIADDAQPTHFEFVHDRVQQAAYEQLPAAERPRLHLAIARELQAREDEGARDQRLFTLAGHYQVAAAAGLVVEPGERARVASLELDAARRAKLSTAYRSACGYLEVGLGLLPARPWDDAYAPCFALHRERVESEFLAGNPERALEFFTPLLARSRTAIERADLFALRATLETERGALPAAIEAGREGLAQLGARLPRNTTTLHVLKEYARFRLLRGSASAEELLARPELEDPARRAELRVLVSMTAAAYFVDTSLASLVLLRIASISVGHGLSELSAYGFIGVGLVQSGAFGQYAAADELGQLARDMNERFDNAQLRTRITLFWATFMMVWARPFAEVKPVLRDAVRLGVESGDLIYAVYSAMTEVFMMVMAGDSLDDVHTQCASAKQFVARRELEDQLATATYIQRVFGERLRGVESEFDEAEYAAGLSDERTPLTMFYYNLYRAMHAYITGDQETAYASLQQALLRTKVAFGSCFIADLRFYECLILARQLPEARGLSRRKLIKTIRQGLAQLRRWARSAPANYGAREALARAEWLRASGREADALGFYNLAIASAREHGAPNVEALACECALRFARARPQDHGVLASAYLEDALRAYRVWGASAKVVALAREFNVSAAGAPDPIANATLTMTRSTTAFALDLHTVVKVSQAISGELEMDGLLRRLTALLVENAGARRGVLVLAEDDALLIEAESSADAGGARVGLATPLADYEALPRRLIQYVARLREDVVLHDASRDPVHGDDPYIAARAPQSVLCTPVLHQGQLACVVYLENDLTAGVFTRRRLALIKQLAAQIAISLTNARLYQRLDEARRAALAADQAKTRFLMNMSHEFRT
ncbi:MAG: AAA family ATPase, partial [Myxococcales bacterium]|nr:AAA family ATPase [Myxococcales bacterium]